MAQTLSEIQAILSDYGVRPRHRLGQNFLHDGNKLRQILDTVQPAPGKTLLEVGPGTGVLTEPLLESGARVVAVEIDDAMADILLDRIGPDTDRWRLIHGDVLDGKHALNPVIDDALGGRETPFDLVANLPYQVASPLLATLCIDWPGMKTAVVMVQREVADRLTADAGGKDYGPLGIVIQSVCEVKMVSTLSPGCFWPRPKVSSAVVRLERRAEPLTPDTALFATFVHALFHQRRKQIGSILGRDAALPDGVDPTQRPESLDLATLIEMARLHAQAS